MSPNAVGVHAQNGHYWENDPVDLGNGEKQTLALARPRPPAPPMPVRHRPRSPRATSRYNRQSGNPEFGPDSRPITQHPPGPEIHNPRLERGSREMGRESKQRAKRARDLEALERDHQELHMDIGTSIKTRGNYRNLSSQKVNAVVNPAYSTDVSVHLELDIEDDYDAMTDEFTFLSRIGHFAHAEKLFEETLSSHVHDPYLLVQYGEMLLEKGSFKRVLELDPKPIESLMENSSVDQSSALLVAYWRLIYLHALSRSNGSSRATFDINDALEQAVYQVFRMAVKDNPSTTEVKFLGLILETLRWPVAQKYAPSIYSVLTDRYNQQLYLSLVSEGRVWDLHDIFASLSPEQIQWFLHSSFGAGDMIHLSRTLLREWKSPVCDPSNDIALLGILNCIQHSIDPSDQQASRVLLQESSSHVEQILRDCPEAVNTRQYLTWVTTSTSIAGDADGCGPTALTKHLASWPGLMLSAEQHSLPTYVPLVVENPGWVNSKSREDLERIFLLVTESAQKLGDYNTEKYALECLIYVTPKREEAFKILSDFQGTTQHDVFGQLQTLLSSYLMALNDDQRRQLRSKLYWNPMLDHRADFISPNFIWVLSLVCCALSPDTDLEADDARRAAWVFDSIDADLKDFAAGKRLHSLPHFGNSSREQLRSQSNERLPPHILRQSGAEEADLRKLPTSDLNGQIRLARIFEARLKSERNDAAGKLDSDESQDLLEAQIRSQRDRIKLLSDEIAKRDGKVRIRVHHRLSSSKETLHGSEGRSARAGSSQDWTDVTDGDASVNHWSGLEAEEDDTDRDSLDDYTDSDVFSRDSELDKDPLETRDWDHPPRQIVHSSLASRSKLPERVAGPGGSGPDALTDKMRRMSINATRSRVDSNPHVVAARRSSSRKTGPGPNHQHQHNNNNEGAAFYAPQPPPRRSTTGKEIHHSPHPHPRPPPHRHHYHYPQPSKKLSRQLDYAEALQNNDDDRATRRQRYLVTTDGSSALARRGQRQDKQQHRQQATEMLSSRAGGAAASETLLGDYDDQGEDEEGWEDGEEMKKKVPAQQQSGLVVEEMVGKEDEDGKEPRGNIHRVNTFASVEDDIYE